MINENCSLGTELAKKHSGLEAALKAINVLRPDEKLTGFEEIYDWQRGGAETYVTAARYTASSSIGQREGGIISKAVLAFGPISERISDMMKRRGILESAGVQTPAVYSTADGCIVEEYIEKSIGEAVKKGNPDETLLSGIVDVAVKLDKAGFRTTNFIQDLRTDGEKVFYTDWGFDLGEPSPEPSQTALLRLRKFARDIKIDPERLEKMYQDKQKLEYRTAG